MDRVKEITGLTLESWEIDNPAEREKYFSTDAVIDAYFKGEKDGLEKAEKLVLKSFEANVETSKEFTNKMYLHLKQNGFHPLGAYIKFESWDRFSSLIPVEEKDFINDNFLSIYDFAADCEHEVSKDEYSLNFTFMPVAGQTFEKSLLCDGFFFRLNTSNESRETRQA